MEFKRERSIPGTPMIVFVPLKCYAPGVVPVYQFWRPLDLTTTVLSDLIGQFKTIKVSYDGVGIAWRDR